MATNEQAIAARPARWRRWAWRGALGVAAALGLLVAGVAFLLSNLDAPWLKSRLQSEIRKASHLELDWAHGRLAVLSGLLLEDLRVRSPVELQATAPDFVRVGRLEATWSPRRLLWGEGPLLDTLLVQTLEVTAVTDLQRGTTIGLLWPETAPVPELKPAGPGLSATLQALFAGRPFIAAGRVEDVRLTWRKVDQGQVVDEASLAGLTLRLDGWRARLGSDQVPLEVRALGHGASLRVALDAAASPAGAALHAEADVEAQDFEPALHLTRLLRLDGRAVFDTARHALTAAITEARLMDGAAEATAEFERSDDGALSIHQAAAHVDAVQAAQDATALGVPVSAGGGSVELKAHGVCALPALALEPAGEVSLAVTALELLQGASRLAKGTAQVRLTPAANGQPSLGFSAQLDGLTHAASSVHALRLEGTAEQAPTGWRGQATVAASELAGVDGARLARLDLVVRLDELLAVSGVTLPVSGRAEVTGTASGARFATDSVRVELGDARLALRASTNGQPPFAATAELDGYLRLVAPDAGAWFDGPAKVTATAREVDPDAGTGAVVATLELADATLHLDAHRTPDAGQLEARLDAKTLALVRPLVALPAGWGVEWGRASASLTTHVTMDALDAPHPTFTHATTLELTGLEATSPRGPVVVPSLQVALDARGTALAHAGTLSLDCQHCAVGPANLGRERVVATFDLDRQVPRASVQFGARGDLGPELHGLLAAGYLRREDRTQVTAELTVGRLAALAPLLDGTGGEPLALGKLGATLHARASLPGKDFSLESAQGSAEADVTGLAWEEAGRTLEVAALALTAKVDSSDAGQHLAATLRAPRLQAKVAENTATLSGLALALEAQGARGWPAATAKLDLSLEEVAQDFAAYPVGAVKLLATGTRDAAGTLTLGRSTVVNEAAGTSLWVEGALAPDPTHPKAMARAELTQDLALAWTNGKQFQGKGTAVLKVDLHSADLRAFQTTGSLALAGADVRVPGAVAEGIHGDLPFAVDFLRDEKGTHPVRTAQINPYALLRFQDQHPLLKAQSFLTMRKLTTPQLTAAPFAANVQVVQSALYLSQLEMGVSGGVVTGELMVDMNEKDSRVRANVRATGLRSEGDEIFTGNAALAISLRDHSIDGRAEVLEISKRQLLVLLDLNDPHRTSASTNRIRQVMAFGYPERVHILFNHGFASAKVTFGGVASLVQLDELQGIPVEALLDRYVFAPAHKGGT